MEVRAAEAAIGGHSGDGAKKGVGSPPENSKKQRCEGEDLNLHGSYPASTSTQQKPLEGDSDARKSAFIGRTEGPTAHWGAPARVQFGEVPHFEPGPESDRLRVEAIAILDAAKRGEGVALKRARAFATNVIASTVTGKLGLEVLAGGPFCSGRLVALAAAILASESDCERDTKAERGG